MKLTATTTSTSLYDLIETADPTAIERISKNTIWNELNWMYWVEIKRKEADVYVETILDTATTDSRPVDEATPIFAFNCNNLQNIFIYWEWDFYVSIV